jgi:hypothetical protein
MKYRDRTTTQIYSFLELQQKFSNVSFPQNWDNTTFDFVNCDPVTEVAQPAVQCTTRVEYMGIQFVNNEWTDVWNEVPRYDDASEQLLCITECANEELTLEWAEVRNHRNILLEKSDWTQLIDSPLSADQKTLWATYRQELRDITQTQTNPFNIIWPIVP